MKRFEKSNRRVGNFAVIFMVVLPVVLGFGALSVDVSYMQLSRSQAQDVADAASQAAIIVLRQRQDAGLARVAARRVAERNHVAGAPADVDRIEFGVWDSADSNPSFAPGGDSHNAVRVSVSRKGSNAVDHLLGKFLGRQTFDVRGQATSATQYMHVVLALDITYSWDPRDFEKARDAAVRFLEVVRSGAGPNDKIGMTVFTGGFAWEFTPLTELADIGAMDAVAAQWRGLRKGNHAGTNHWPNDWCEMPEDWPEDPRDPWHDRTGGGCYPNMPRAYWDEMGTDHTTGLQMARRMFREENDPTAFKAMVMLTDGRPVGLPSRGTSQVYETCGWEWRWWPPGYWWWCDTHTVGYGTARNGYSDDPSHGGRWREYVGPLPHSQSAIENDSISLSRELWRDYRVHNYVISFVADSWFMHQMPQGQGYYKLTNDANSLVPIFEDVAASLPLAIVE